MPRLMMIMMMVMEGVMIGTRQYVSKSIVRGHMSRHVTTTENDSLKAIRNSYQDCAGRDGAASLKRGQ